MAIAKGYEVSSGSWGTDHEKGTDALTGGYSIKFNPTTPASDPAIKTIRVVVAGGNAYRITINFKSSSTSGLVHAKVYEYTFNAASPLATTTIFSDKASSTSNYERISEEITLDSTTRQIVVEFIKDNSAFTVYMDGITINEIGPRFSAYASAATSLAALAWTKVLFATENYDLGGKFASSRFTASEKGIYHFDASVRIASAAINTTYACGIYKNGALHKRGNHSVSSSTALSRGCSCDIELDKDDYIEVFFYSGHSSAISTNIGQDYTWFNGHKI